MMARPETQKASEYVQKSEGPKTAFHFTIRHINSDSFRI